MNGSEFETFRKDVVKEKTCWRNDLKQNCELDLWSRYWNLLINTDMSGSELKILEEDIVNVEEMIKT